MLKYNQMSTEFIIVQTSYIAHTNFSSHAETESIDAWKSSAKLFLPIFFKIIIIDYNLKIVVDKYKWVDGFIRKNVYVYLFSLRAYTTIKPQLLQIIIRTGIILENLWHC